MIPIISVVGNSNSGKTTLLEKVISKLKAKGYRVAVIKHCHHDFDIDKPGKDSWRLSQAGGSPLAISSPHKVAFIEHMDNELTLSQIAEFFGRRVDIVLTEGYKRANIAKILVLNPEFQWEHQGGKNVVLTVSPYRSSLGELVFRNNDIAKIVNLLIAQIDASLTG